MHMLAANWGWLLLLTFVLLVTAVLLQVRNMRKVLGSANSFLKSPTGFGQPAVEMDSVFKRFIPVIVFALCGSLTGILFIVGIVANLMGK